MVNSVPRARGPPYLWVDGITAAVGAYCVAAGLTEIIANIQGTEYSAPYAGTLATLAGASLLYVSTPRGHSERQGPAPQGYHEHTTDEDGEDVYRS